MKHWDALRSFGFIHVGSASYFCHATAIVNRVPLALGELVAFTPDADDPRGPRALGVERLSSECPKCEAALRGLGCRECGFTLGAGG